MSSTRVPSLYARLVQRFYNFQFMYSERREVDIHQSHINSQFLFGIRLVAFIYLSGIYLWTMASETSFAVNIIYLTMIGYTCTWIYFGLALQVSLLEKLTYKVKHMNLFMELIFQVAICSEIPITIVFWTLLLPILLGMEGITSTFWSYAAEVIVIQSNLHAVPLVFLTLDYIFNTFCFHIRHITVLIGFTLIYLTINLAYSLSVKPIYKPLNWRDVQSYILALGCILATLLIHFICRLVYRKWKEPILKAKDEQKRTLLMHNRDSMLSEDAVNRYKKIGSQHSSSTERYSEGL